MEKDHVMLDTNILLDFFLIDQKKNKKIHNRLKNSSKIREEHLKGNFVNVYSKYNLWEFQDVLSKLFIERKFIDWGYSLPEFNEAKKEIFLLKEELIDVKKVSDEMFEGSIKIELEIRDDMIEKMINEGISFFDTILLYYAYMFENCKYFITRDKVLIKKLEKISFKIPKIEVLTISQFLNLLNKKNSSTQKSKPINNPLFSKQHGL